jgi:TRAP transporter TAXI family solute receptor
MAQPARVVLGTATPGGGFPVYGAALIDALKTADPDLAVEARNTKGSTENVPMLERGDLDLGLVTGEVLHEALAGIGRPPANVKVLAAMYSQPGMFVVRADGPARRIDDLKGKPVAFGAAGSGLVVLARYVLDGLGLDIERDFQAIFLERAGDGPAMVLDGRVAALWGAGSGWPGFTAVARGPEKARFITPSQDQVGRITAKHPFLRPMTVPAGSYPGQEAPLSRWARGALSRPGPTSTRRSCSAWPELSIKRRACWDRNLHKRARPRPPTPLPHCRIRTCYTLARIAI